MVFAFTYTLSHTNPHIHKYAHTHRCVHTVISFEFKWLNRQKFGYAKRIWLKQFIYSTQYDEAST